ncbi:MAG: imidazoleglycerol-phosphate dehydratase, partial [Alphaproteobacteria bacterium]|nr:imidazoleglycerol-phosphate dehydratase [Alphaproteobacteria bacterium]
MRRAQIERNTKETKIKASVNLDGTGYFKVSTGIGFLNHMVEQLSHHSLIDIDLDVQGDLHIDFHHTTEDSALALGEAVKQALGDKKGITRFGHSYVPMDETLSRCVI